jgi:hypothetical protein
MNLSFVDFKVNLINNSEQWWVDIDATKLVCTKKRMFFPYKKKWMEKTYI